MNRIFVALAPFTFYRDVCALYICVCVACIRPPSKRFSVKFYLHTEKIPYINVVCSSQPLYSYSVPLSRNLSSCVYVCTTLHTTAKKNLRPTSKSTTHTHIPPYIDGESFSIWNKIVPCGHPYSLWVRVCRKKANAKKRSLGTIKKGRKLCIFWAFFKRAYVSWRVYAYKNTHTHNSNSWSKLSDDWEWIGVVWLRFLRKERRKSVFIVRLCVYTRLLNVWARGF